MPGLYFFAVISITRTIDLIHKKVKQINI